MSNLFDQDEAVQPPVAENPTQDATGISIANFSDEEKKIVPLFQVEERVKEIVAVCKGALAIVDDKTNDYAREAGKNASKVVSLIDAKRKELNAPHQATISLHNTIAKKLSSPIETKVEELRAAVSKYELDKEAKRLAELKRIEEERKKKEEAERKERERVAGIKQKILDTKNQAFSQIDQIQTTKAIEEFEKKLKAWKPKEDVFMEFMPDLQEVIKEIQSRIDSRKVIIADIEKAEAEAKRLRGVAKKQAEEAAALKAKELELKKAEEKAAEEKRQLEAQTAEVNAKQSLTVYLASLQVNDIGKRTDEFVALFGSAVKALEKKEDIVAKINQERIASYNETTLKGEKIKNQRTNYLFKIEDETKVPREYLCVDEKKVKEAIVKNREALEKDLASFKIDGIIIYPETKTVFK